MIFVTILTISTADFGMPGGTGHLMAHHDVHTCSDIDCDRSIQLCGVEIQGLLEAKEGAKHTATMQAV